MQRLEKIATMQQIQESEIEEKISEQKKDVQEIQNIKIETEEKEEPKNTYRVDIVCSEKQFGQFKRFCKDFNVKIAREKQIMEV
jgi:hypothetical protein